MSKIKKRNKSAKQQRDKSNIIVESKKIIFNFSSGKQHKCLCIEYLNSILTENEKLRTYIFDFTENFNSIHSRLKKKSFLRFMDFLFKLEYVNCEYGAFLIERCIWDGLFVKLAENRKIMEHRNIEFSHSTLTTNDETSTTVDLNCEYKQIILKRIHVDIMIITDDNILINEKIQLYSFIEPKHLDLFTLGKSDIKNLIKQFRKMKESYSPSFKMNIFARTIELIIEICDKYKTIENILPILILTIIKSEIKDILVQFEVIKQFKRPIIDNCNKTCIQSDLYENDTKYSNNTVFTYKHLNDHSTYGICKCYIYLDEGQTKYNLTVFESALFFIKTMEFNKLNISREEYDRKINELNKN